MIKLALGLLGVVAIWQIYLLITKSKKNSEETPIKEKKPRHKEEKRYASNKLTNKTRNMILLSIILLIIIGIGYYSHVKGKEKLDKTKAELAKFEKELEKLKNEQKRKPVVEEKLYKTKEEVFLNNKEMPTFDNSTKSLQYFFSLSENFSNSIQFDFILADSGLVKNEPNVKFNKYLVTGTAYMNQIFSFIDQIERQPAFYTVESAALNSLSAEDKGKVQFSLEIYAYYASDGFSDKKTDLQKLKKRRIAYNLFYPRIHEPILYDNEEFMKLIDIETAEIVALSGERVFIKNGNNGIIHGLNIGDRVKYGYLENINWNKQEAIFRLTRFGVPERIKKIMPHNK